MVLFVAACFGLVAGMVKGDGAGLRDGLGNLSSPWLLVAIVPAWWAGSWRRGAVTGVAATLVALAGFYVAMALFMYDRSGIELGLMGLLREVAVANRVWFAAGLLSGPICGGLSATIGARLATWWLGVIAGGVLALEFLAVRLAQGLPLPVIGGSWAVDDWRMYQVEAVAGLAILGLSATVWRQRTR